MLKLLSFPCVAQAPAPAPILLSCLVFFSPTDVFADVLPHLQEGFGFLPVLLPLARAVRLQRYYFYYD